MNKSVHSFSLGKGQRLRLKYNVHVILKVTLLMYRYSMFCFLLHVVVAHFGSLPTKKQKKWKIHRNKKTWQMATIPWTKKKTQSFSNFGTDSKQYWKLVKQQTRNIYERIGWYHYFSQQILLINKQTIICNANNYT